VASVLRGASVCSSANETLKQRRASQGSSNCSQLGWTEGRNIQIDLRFSDGNPERTRAAAAELIALASDVSVAYANPAVSALQPLTRTIPIVFTQVSAPIESGFVSNLAKPEANTTGFHSFEPSMGGKSLELLNENRAPTFVARRLPATPILPRMLPSCVQLKRHRRRLVW